MLGLTCLGPSVQVCDQGATGLCWEQLILPWRATLQAADVTHTWRPAAVLSGDGAQQVPSLCAPCALLQLKTLFFLNSGLSLSLFFFPCEHHLSALPVPCFRTPLSPRGELSHASGILVFAASCCRDTSGAGGQWVLTPGSHRTVTKRESSYMATTLQNTAKDKRPRSSLFLCKRPISFIAGA